MKRALLVGVTLSLFLLVLAGCAPKAAPSAPIPEAPRATSPTSAPAVPQPVSVKQA